MREVTSFRNIGRGSRRSAGSLPLCIACQRRDFWLLSRFPQRFPSLPMHHDASPDDPDDGNGALRIVRSRDRPGAAASDPRQLPTA